MARVGKARNQREEERETETPRERTETHLAVVHITILILEFLSQLALRQLGFTLLLELLGDCFVRGEVSSSSGDKEREEHRGNIRAIASSMRVISWKCLVLGRPRARIPKA